MRIYLISRYSRRKEMLGYAEQLRNLGFEVTSRWIFGNNSTENAAEGKHPDMDDPRNREFAINDRQDILAADIVVNFTETDEVLYPRGSRHCEFAIAYEHFRVCVIVGPLENIFHHLPGVLRYDTFPDFLYHLEEVLMLNPSRTYLSVPEYSEYYENYL